MKNKKEDIERYIEELKNSEKIKDKLSAEEFRTGMNAETICMLKKFRSEKGDTRNRKY